MAYVALADTHIRNGLERKCKLALSNCAKEFNTQARTGRKQGLEGIFEKAFLQAFPKLASGWGVRKQVNRAEFQTASSLRNGRIDVVATYQKSDRAATVGIEFKVCELPRSHSNAPDGATYDIGQIAWDFGELAGYKMEFGYCIAVIYGGIPAMNTATKKTIARAFHNALYVDAQTEKHFGKPKTAERKYDISYIRQVLPDMKLDKPYYDKEAHRSNFCILDKKNKLAIVGLFVPRKRPRRTKPSA